MFKALRYILPVIFLAAGVFVFWWLVSTRPEPRRFAFQAPPPSVEVKPLESQTYQVILKSQGTVRARTESVLAAEVRGRIVNIAPNFREGGFFEEGDLLVQIDDADYQAEAVAAEAALLQAQLNLYEERERHEQARLDWERLNPGVAPSPLALREPQLKQAEATVASAEARLARARRDLERTQVRAPFAGRILTQNVDVGQYVAPGNPLARIYAIDYAEVRLPLSEKQLEFLDLAETYRGDEPEAQNGPPVILTGAVSGQSYQWRGRIVRAEGAVDIRTRQLSVVAQIPDPYGRNKANRPPLKIGSFVEAAIEGRKLENVFVIPRKLLRENRFVLVVDKENRLHRRDVEVVWSADDEVVISKGLDAGETLCMTLVPYAVEGMLVSTRPYGVEAATAVASSGDAGARAGGRPAGASGQAGGFAERLLSMLPPDKPLPDELKQKLDRAAGDRQATRAVMGEIRAWAEKEGIDLPRPPGR